MKDERSYYYIEQLLDTLYNEGIGAIYEIVKTWKPSSSYSIYSSLINDLIGCRPSANEWKNPQNRELFRNEVIYYCDYWKAVAADDQ